MEICLLHLSSTTSPYFDLIHWVAFNLFFCCVTMKMIYNCYTRTCTEKFWFPTQPLSSPLPRKIPHTHFKFHTAKIFHIIQQWKHSKHKPMDELTFKRYIAFKITLPVLKLLADRDFICGICKMAMTGICTKTISAAVSLPKTPKHFCPPHTHP